MVILHYVFPTILNKCPEKEYFQFLVLNVNMNMTVYQSINVALYPPVLQDRMHVLELKVLSRVYPASLFGQLEGRIPPPLSSLTATPTYQ
jgi:hypothetical protein